MFTIHQKTDVEYSETFSKDGAAVNLANTTVVLYMFTKISDKVAIITVIGEVADEENGVANFEIDILKTDRVGFLKGQYELIKGTNGSITSFADASGGNVKATCSADHGLSNGQAVTIAGTNDYDGTHIISNITADTFDFVHEFVATDTGIWSKGKESKTDHFDMQFKASFNAA